VVYDERIGEAKVAGPFATLANPKLPAGLDGKALIGSRASSGGGSSKGLLVELGGFEPPTSWVIREGHKSL
jgi:hypothetical protein